MEYWRGLMSWPIEGDWGCPICEADTWLEWGLVNGQCRCTICHTEYMMREGDERVTTPICQLKPEYIEPAKRGYNKFKKPIDTFTDKDWNELFKEPR